jgi:ankyrin repeat protein
MKKKLTLLFLVSISISSYAQIGSILKANLLAYSLSEYDYETAFKLIKEEPELLYTPSESGLLPLTLAISKNNLELIKKLVNLGAPLQHSNYTQQPLVYAILLDKQDSVRLLLKLGANPDLELGNGLTPLHLTLVLARFSMLEDLLKAGENPNIADKKGITPLHMAVTLKNWDVIKLLAKYHASPITFNQSGKTPFTLFFNNDFNNDNIKDFLNSFEGQERQIVNTFQKEAPLTFCTKLENTDCINLLLKYGADLNVLDRDGNSPLMLAIHQNNTRLVKLFLEYHANLDIKNKARETPITLAQKQNNQDILDLLKSKS